jgi:hypothetical protein
MQAESASPRRSARARRTPARVDVSRDASRDEAQAAEPVAPAVPPSAPAEPSERGDASPALVPHAHETRHNWRMMQLADVLTVAQGVVKLRRMAHRAVERVHARESDELHEAEQLEAVHDDAHGDEANAELESLAADLAREVGQSLFSASAATHRDAPAAAEAKAADAQRSDVRFGDAFRGKLLRVGLGKLSEAAVLHAPQPESTPVLVNGQLPVEGARGERLARKSKPDTAGAKWFDMPAPRLDDETKRDLKVLSLRAHMDPKRFYKRDAGAPTYPRYFEFGRVVEGAADFFSSRLPRKQRGEHFVQEVIDDLNRRKFLKRKVREVQEMSTGRGRKRVKR